MDISGEVAVQTDRESLWSVLNNPDKLKAATPGCQSLVEESPGRFAAAFKLGIAAIRGEYTGWLEIRDAKSPESYRLQIHAQGSAGFVDADMVIELVQEGSSTTVRYAVTAQTGGLIAGVGQRILSGVAKMFIKDFFKSLTTMAA